MIYWETLKAKTNKINKKKKENNFKKCTDNLVGPAIPELLIKTCKILF